MVFGIHCNFLMFYLFEWKFVDVFFFSFTRQNVRDRVNKRGHSLSPYAKFSEKLIFLTNWYAHVRVHIRGVRNIHFSGNIAYVLNEWPLSERHNIEETWVWPFFWPFGTPLTKWLFKNCFQFSCQTKNLMQFKWQQAAWCTPLPQFPSKQYLGF